MDTLFILGLAAEVEQLFNTDEAIMSQKRRSMTPQMFEALLVLCFNNRFWDTQLFSQAILCSKVN